MNKPKEITAESILAFINDSEHPEKESIVFILDCLHAVKNTCEICTHHLDILIDSNSRELALNVIEFGNHFAIDTCGTIAFTFDIVNDTLNNIIDNKLQVLLNVLYIEQLVNIKSEDLIPEIQTIIHNFETTNVFLSNLAGGIKAFFNGENSSIIDGIDNAKNQLSSCSSMVEALLDDLYTSIFNMEIK